MSFSPVMLPNSTPPSLKSGPALPVPLLHRQVVEEVAVKVETELTAMRVRAAGLEGSLRARDREVERLSRQIGEAAGGGRGAAAEARQSKTEDAGKGGG